MTITYRADAKERRAVRILGVLAGLLLLLLASCTGLTEVPSVTPLESPSETPSATSIETTRAPIPSPTQVPAETRTQTPSPVPTRSPTPTSLPTSQAVRWVAVKGGEALAQDPSWRCVGGVLVIDGKLVIGAGDNYVTPINRRGPYLALAGDFRVSAAIEAQTRDLAAIVLFGALSQGEWWAGIKRLDVGLASGQVQLIFWDGTFPQPAEVHAFPASGLSGIVHLQIERVANEFVVSANGGEVGRIADPGAFPEDQAYLGANVAPNNELTIHELSVEAAAGQGNGVQVVHPADMVLYTPSDTPLRDLAQARGLWIGAAVSPHPLRCERAYAEALGHEFNFVTTENAMKFGPIHPQRERYAFQDADEIVDYAQAHDMLVRGHTLVWHNQLPNWIEEGEWTREELIAVLREHITTVVGRYRGRVTVWDVVNEAVADDGSLRDTVWLRVIGPEYLDMAFRWAHEADPDAVLFYNDYNGEGLNAKSDAIYDLVQGFLSRDVPVHGVGLQMHVSTQWSPRPQDVLVNMDRLAGLGLEVHITEMDVRTKGQPTKEKLARQAAIYGELMETCLAAQRCTAYVLWGFTDRHSWVPGFFEGWGYGLIFDEDYRPKPAYEALRDALAEQK